MTASSRCQKALCWGLGVRAAHPFFMVRHGSRREVSQDVAVTWSGRQTGDSISRDPGTYQRNRFSPSTVPAAVGIRMPSKYQKAIKGTSSSGQ